jgi:hypothetical protein
MEASWLSGPLGTAFGRHMFIARRRDFSTPRACKLTVIQRLTSHRTVTASQARGACIERSRDGRNDNVAAQYSSPVQAPIRHCPLSFRPEYGGFSAPLDESDSASNPKTCRRTEWRNLASDARKLTEHASMSMRSAVTGTADCEQPPAPLTRNGRDAMVRRGAIAIIERTRRRSG